MTVCSRVFAKPFVAAFPHDDVVTCLARNPQHLNSLVCSNRTRAAGSYKGFPVDTSPFHCSCQAVKTGLFVSGMSQPSAAYAGL